MERINDVTKDAFNALIQLRSLGDDSYVAPETVHQRMVGFFDDLFRREHASEYAVGDDREHAEDADRDRELE